jgi:hypothetical protein
MMKAPIQVAAGFSLRSGVGDMYRDESFYSRRLKNMKSSAKQRFIAWGGLLASESLLS